jgi:hypothetical protein
MIQRGQINELEQKLSGNTCIVQAVEKHEEKNLSPLFPNRLIKILPNELGEITDLKINQDYVNITIKWPENRFINYSLQDCQKAPFEILRYVPKDHPAQQKLL